MGGTKRAVSERSSSEGIAAAKPFAGQKRYLCCVKRIQYTGNNFDEIKRLCGDKVLAPYFCMGFSMLSLETEEGFVTVNEGDCVVMDDSGKISVER